MWKRKIRLHLKGRDARYFLTPRLTIGELLHYVAHELRDDRNRPFAVDVLVNDRVILPTETSRRHNPPLSAEIVMVQNCSHDVLKEIPNKAWVLA